MPSPLNRLWNPLHRVLWWPVRRTLRDEFRNQPFVAINERPVELSFTFRHLSRLPVRTILDVGTGKTALPHLMRNCGYVVTAMDNVKDFWPRGMVNRHWHIVDDDITSPHQVDGLFDFVTCISVLEHIEAAAKAVENLAGKLLPGGHLVITVPYREEEGCPNVYALPRSNARPLPPYIAQAFCRRDVVAWCQKNGMALVEQEHWRFWDGLYWTEGSRISPPQPATATTPHQLTCLLFRREGSL